MQPGGGDGGAGECLGKAAVGEKMDRQEQVVHRGRAVPALVLIRQVQPAGVTSKRQRKVTEFLPKNYFSEDSTGRNEGGKVTREKSRK